MRGRPRASAPVRVLFAATVALAALAAPVASGLGVRPTGIISAGDLPIAAGKAADVTVYLVRGGRLAPVVRPGLPGHPYLGITQLGVPVTAEERRGGMRTEVPGEAAMRVRQDGIPGQLNIEIIGEPVDEDGYIVDIARWSRAALGQLVCTAQAVPGVKRVMLVGDVDEQEASFGRALTCAEFKDLRG
ncbi:hypothetical protein ACH35V_09790 [Actinomadura sp. 1N219]|uniref:hypothetical protein n=1 Tax=Actinomadura sp. 1N219 TaxID=3375152 RepID=UPI0037B79882